MIDAINFILGISGAAAVILGAYGAHKQFPDSHEKNRDLKGIFDTANRYHFYHTVITRKITS